MGFFDRLFGGTTEREPEAAPAPAAVAEPVAAAPAATDPRRTPQHAAAPGGTPGRDAQGRTDDDIAVERYQYLLRTAPPETIEKVHQEAFAKLSPEQREMLFARLSKNAPTGDAPRDSDPASLAVSATRSELRQPGTMERSMGGNGMSFGGMVGSSLLGTVAGYVIGSALVGSLFPSDGAANEADASGDPGAESADSGADPADAGADTVSADGGDVGGTNDFGGDFTGGDFGSSDFGGGDMGGGFDF
jgi:hypothetical protein